MKNYFLILAALCCVLFTGCKKEDVGFASKIPSDPTEAFPDPIFRAYVLENFDTNGDGKISEEEAEAVTKIYLENFDNRNDESKLIKSLEGIQYFTNLTYLNCRYHQLTTLDVSKYTQLTELYCSGNPLTTLDVSKNTQLTVLWCSTNQLTTLNVSKNTQLTDLRCAVNQLTTLDVSNNTKLAYLNCYSNQIEELDLSKTNLVNSDDNKDSSSYYPLDCAPMETLKKVYLKKGWSIKWITEDWDRSSNYIPDHTEIVFVD